MLTERIDTLCRYHYDPLDRLADCMPAAQSKTQRFYFDNRLVSEIQGSVQRSIFQHNDKLLAQQLREEETCKTALLATDQQRSVLQMLDAKQPHAFAYTAYGYHPNGLLSLLGFNGERPDPVTGHYLLGSGYRAFNPVLMRFNSSDSLSPFGKGGLNSYAYCVGDPVNRNDPTGHTWAWVKTLLRGAGLMRQSTPPVRPTALRNPLAAGTFPSRQPPTAPPAASLGTATRSTSEKSPAWTTTDSTAFQVNDLPARRGSHSYYFDTYETPGSPSISRSPSQTSLPRSRSHSSGSLGEFSNNDAAGSRRTGIILDDNDPQLLELRRRLAVPTTPHDDLPPPPYELPPPYEQATLVNRIRRS